MNRKSCEGCVYYRVLYTSGSWTPPRVCNYCYDTGEPRGCPADHCDKKKWKTKASAHADTKPSGRRPVMVEETPSGRPAARAR